MMPDKIYVPILPRIENSIISEHCVGTAWDNKEHITIPDIEEYIRKDALLEWVKEEMMKTIKQSDAYGRRNAFMDVIDKINSI
jgi:hypothetical protein